jgi:ATP:cob(I)alamin adenosyltransferase
MPPLSKLYTRAGDRGQTRLGGGQKVPKSNLRLECYGTIDELNSHPGPRALAGARAPEIAHPLLRIQNELFDLGSDLCFLEEDKGKWPLPQVRPDQIEALEREIDSMQAAVGPLANFILPGETGRRRRCMSRARCAAGRSAFACTSGGEGARGAAGAGVSQSPLGLALRRSTPGERQGRGPGIPSGVPAPEPVKRLFPPAPLALAARCSPPS